MARRGASGYGAEMTTVLCPSCRNAIDRVRPVRIATDTDDKRWAGRTPHALGFICPQCGVLLPVMSPGERDDP